MAASRKFHTESPQILGSKSIRLGDLATRICAPMSFTYERLFVWASWRPGFVYPCPIPMNDYSSGPPGDQDLCTLVLYLRTIIRLGDLATRICAPLSCTYERLFAWATWPPELFHPCPISMNDFSPGRPCDQDLCTTVL